jgi:uncharacterized protein (TIGR02594 family)
MSFFSDAAESIKNLFKKPTKQGLPEDHEIIEEAIKWIGMNENSPGVDVFRMAVNNSADGEPWCAAFMMYCARSVGLRHGREPSLYMSELCTEIWNKSPVECRMDAPAPGSVVIWNHPGTVRGHTGIVESVDLSNDTMVTIEGNTSGKKGAPDGVHRKTRYIKGTPGMIVLGFLKPFV